jgi:hypothetical protein
MSTSSSFQQNIKRKVNKSIFTVQHRTRLRKKKKHTVFRRIRFSTFAYRVSSKLQWLSSHGKAFNATHAKRYKLFINLPPPPYQQWHKIKPAKISTRLAEKFSLLSHTQVRDGIIITKVNKINTDSDLFQHKCKFCYRLHPS